MYYLGNVKYAKSRLEIEYKEGKTSKEHYDILVNRLPEPKIIKDLEKKCSDVYDRIKDFL